MVITEPNHREDITTCEKVRTILASSPETTAVLPSAITAPQETQDDAVRSFSNRKKFRAETTSRLAPITWS